jgi:hypothetical protein
MLIDFFLKLKSHKLPVSIKEYLTLLEAMDKGVIGPSVDDFYYLSRIALVKDEGSAHPSELLELLDGDRIESAGNPNLSRVDIPELNAEIDLLSASALDPAEGGYADLDRAFMEEAVWAPVGQVRVAALVSDRIDLDRVSFHPLFGLDLTSLELVPR